MSNEFTITGGVPIECPLCTREITDRHLRVRCGEIWRSICKDCAVNLLKDADRLLAELDKSEKTLSDVSEQKPSGELNSKESVPG